MEVAGEAADGGAAVQQYFVHKPDVIVLGLSMPGINGIAATRTIVQKAPQAKILMIGTDEGDEDVYQALKAGAKGYLLKNSSRELLLESIRAAHGGRATIPSKIAEQLALRVAAPELTKRELNVLDLIVAGKSNKEIGALLGVSEGTVKIYASHIFAKLDADGRTDAIRIALQRGIVHLRRTT